MAFQFSLAALLRFRLGQERQQEILLRDANQQLATLKREGDAVARGLAELSAGVARELQSGVSAAELQFDLSRRSVLLVRAKQLQQDLTQAEAVRDSRRQEFQQARQQREVVETLRRNQFQIYDQQEKRQEQNRLDDLFLLRREFLRRS